MSDESQDLTPGRPLRVYDRDGRWSDFSTDELVGRGLNRFPNWRCGAGAENLSISMDGDVFVATCRVGGSLGNVYTTFECSSEWVTCPLPACSCGADLFIPKCQSDNHRTLLKKTAGLPTELIARAPHLSQIVGLERVHASNRKQVYWEIGRRCNFNCSYCWPWIHNTTDPHRSEEELIRATNLVFERFSKGHLVNFVISGGEPTLNPALLPWLRHIRSFGHHVSLHSNGSRLPPIYRDLIQLADLNLSYHFEFARQDAFLANVAAVTAEKVRLQNQGVGHLEVKLMMAPGRYLEALELERRLLEIPHFADYCTWAVVPIRVGDNGDEVDPRYSSFEAAMFGDRRVANAEAAGPLISVVIPTHKRPRDLAVVLESLQDQEVIDHCEVLVASNLPDPRTAEVVNRFAPRFKNLKLLVAGQVGANVARNCGLDQARAPIVAFVDDDCRILHRGYLKHIFNLHDRNPGLTAIGGPYVALPNASPIERAYHAIARRWLSRRTPEHEVIHLVGGNVSYKREHLTARDLRFDERISFGGAETELHHRLYAHGLRLGHFADLAIEHRVRLSPAEFLRKSFLQGIGAYRRGQSGLVVNTQLGEYSDFEDRTQAVRRWTNLFHHAFALGQKFATTEAAPTSWNVTRFLLHSARQLATQKVRDLGKAALLRWMGGEIHDDSAFAPPLERFYMLGSDDPSILGASHGDLNLELTRAKFYHFEKVLIANGTSLEAMAGTLDRIRNAGLKPYALLDGCERRCAPVDTLKRLVQAGIGIHWLLGAPNDKQRQAMRYLVEQGVDFSSTYHAESGAEAIWGLLDLPLRARHRVHFMFPSVGDMWHPRQSEMDVHATLKRVSEKLHDLGSPVVFRGPAWRLQPQTESTNEIFPIQPIDLNLNDRAEAPQFSVVIPSYNSKMHLPAVIDALAAQTVAAHRFEVIVVDDGSGDGSYEHLKNHLLSGAARELRLKYIYWPRQRAEAFRAGLARNLGVAHARGQYLCFLDSDILAPANYLERLEEEFKFADVIQARREMLTLEASHRALQHGLAAPLVAYRDDDYWEGFKAAPTWSDLPHPWKYTCTYALSVKRELFERVGWFATDFFCYGFEDTDLGFRLARRRAKFHICQTSVYHLYPERSEHCFHFDKRARDNALTLSARLFYRLRLDQEIYREFCYSFYNPIKGQIAVKTSRLATIDWSGWSRIWAQRLEGRMRFVWGTAAGRALGAAHAQWVRSSWFVRRHGSQFFYRWIYPSCSGLGGAIHARTVRTRWFLKRHSSRIYYSWVFPVGSRLSGVVHALCVRSLWFAHRHGSQFYYRWVFPVGSSVRGVIHAHSVRAGWLVRRQAEAMYHRFLRPKLGWVLGGLHAQWVRGRWLVQRRLNGIFHHAWVPLTGAVATRCGWMLGQVHALTVRTRWALQRQATWIWHRALRPAAGAVCASGGHGLGQIHAWYVRSQWRLHSVFVQLRSSLHLRLGRSVGRLHAGYVRSLWRMRRLWDQFALRAYYDLLRPLVMKPYYFLEYQVNKRLLSGVPHDKN